MATPYAIPAEVQRMFNAIDHAEAKYKASTVAEKPNRRIAFNILKIRVFSGQYFTQYNPGRSMFSFFLFVVFCALITSSNRFISLISPETPFGIFDDEDDEPVQIDNELYPSPTPVFGVVLEAFKAGGQVFQGPPNRIVDYKQLYYKIHRPRKQMIATRRALYNSEKRLTAKTSKQMRYPEARLKFVGLEWPTGKTSYEPETITATPAPLLAENTLANMAATAWNQALIGLQHAQETRQELQNFPEDLVLQMIQPLPLQ